MPEFQESFCPKQVRYLLECSFTNWVAVGWNPVAASRVCFWQYFLVQRRVTFFCLAFVFQRGMSIGMLKYILYFKNEGLHISWISQYNSILGLKNGFQNTVVYSVSAGRNFIFLIRDGSIQDLGRKCRQKRIYLFWVFGSLIFKFFSKTRSHEEHTQMWLN